MFEREPSLNSVLASALSVDVESERNRSLKNINRVEHTHEPSQTHTVKEDACESNKGGQMNSVERVSTMG